MRALAAIASFAVVIGIATPASAQNSTETTPPASQQIPIRDVRVPTPKRPVVLIPLYGAYAGLQMADAATTMTVLGRGGREANPLMVSLTRHPAAFFAMKAGIAGAAIFSAERMWREGKRKSAVMLLVGSNLVVGAIVEHNRRVINQIGR